MLRRTPLLRKKRIKARSDKQSKNLRIYFRLRREYLAKNAACEAGPILLNAKLPEFYHRPVCAVWSKEIHHTKRRGPHLNDVETFCAVCRPCHRWIETHAQKARELGLLQ